MQHFPQITLPQGPGSWLLYVVTCFSAAVRLHVAVERPFLRLRDRVTRHSFTSANEMCKEPATAHMTSAASERSITIPRMRCGHTQSDPNFRMVGNPSVTRARTATTG
jgi:hypothetical protein